MESKQTSPVITSRSVLPQPYAALFMIIEVSPNYESNIRQLNRS